MCVSARIHRSICSFCRLPRCSSEKDFSLSTVAPWWHVWLGTRSLLVIIYLVYTHTHKNKIKLENVNLYQFNRVKSPHFGFNRWINKALKSFKFGNNFWIQVILPSPFRISWLLLRLFYLLKQWFIPKKSTISWRTVWRAANCHKTETLLIIVAFTFKALASLFVFFCFFLQKSRYISLQETLFVKNSWISISNPQYLSCDEDDKT